MNEPDPLPESIRAMLAVEAEGEELPQGFAESLRARLDATLPPPDGSGGGSGTPPTSGGSPNAGAGPSTSWASWASHAGVFVVGAALGAFVWNASPYNGAPLPEPSPGPSVTLPAPPEPTVPEPPVTDDEPPADSSPPDPNPASQPASVTRPPQQPRPHDEPSAPAAPDDGRALLTQARAALARRLPADALRALARHREEHPRSPLAEERSALTVQALAASGDVVRARQEAAIFRARYPRSIFLAGVLGATEDGEREPSADPTTDDGSP